MKQVEVVAAIICKNDKIFATQRGYGEFKDWWEFPGGKMEAIPFFLKIDPSGRASVMFRSIPVGILSGRVKLTVTYGAFSIVQPVFSILSAVFFPLTMPT